MPDKQAGVDSPAIEFFRVQHRARTRVREQFSKDAGDFLNAHQFVLSGVVSGLARIEGRKWPDDLPEDIQAKMTQVAQLTALFLHGVDSCEVAIAEGLYGQAGTLLRQQMEIIGAIDEVWLGKRNPKSTPKVSSLPPELRRHYGGLSEIAHAAVPDYLARMFTLEEGGLIGSPTVPQYSKDLALFLYSLELGLLLHFAVRQDDALKNAYGDGLNEEEKKLLFVGKTLADRAAEELEALKRYE